VGSVAIFGLAWLLVQRGMGTLAMWVGYAEVSAHATYLTHTLGADAGYALFMFCLGPFVFLAMRPDQVTHRVAGVVLALVGGLALWLHGRSSVPDIALSDDEVTGLFLMNASGVLVALVLIVAWFARLAEQARAAQAAERERSEALLRNILPERITERLKAGETTIADDVASASVLFADLVGFTKLSSQVAPRELIAMLDSIFTGFDALAETLGVEKIKTIGDAYMVVSGLSESADDRSTHAERLATMALGMREVVEAYAQAAGRPLNIRVGIHSGPVVAGVIGTQKFAYDLWGDTVNTASRMESHGEPGRIQVSRATHDLLGDTFVLERRGEIDVKGKGAMQTWWLHGGPNIQPSDEGAEEATLRSG